MIEEGDKRVRTEPRTNMFVMATISAASAWGPVKVRNLSPSGALIEGAVLPAAKEKVCLRRGPLRVTGEVVWCGSGQAGLRFLSRVEVKEWLPASGNRLAQQRVDELVQQVRGEGSPCRPSVISETAELHPIGGSQLVELATALEALGNDLAGDAGVVDRHFSKLQTLDIAAQLLRKLSAARQ